ncbi:MAG: hypothetical protein ACOH12_10140 [Parvibaculaceae bacterium]
MKVPPTFQKAVEIAREDLIKAKDEGVFKPATAWKTMVSFRAMKVFGDTKRTGVGGVEVKGFHQIRENAKHEETIELKTSYKVNSSDTETQINRMIVEDKDDAAIFDILSTIAAAYLDSGMCVPEMLGHWAADVLLGEKKRPARRGKFEEGTGLRNTAIWLATRRLVHRGMIATRNDASAPTSACDAVAEALKLLGESPTTYASVKRIWNEFEHWPS